MARSERDILENPRPSSRSNRREVLSIPKRGDGADGLIVRRGRCLRLACMCRLARPRQISSPDSAHQCYERSTASI
jgi:hypothetical protein